MPTEAQLTEEFEAERPRLVRIAARILGDRSAAEDVVQQAWLRLNGTTEPIVNLPGWLTTATSRLCLDQLRARTPLPVEDVEPGHPSPDPVDDVVLADTVGVALQVVLDLLTPTERVAFVLHDSFGFDFPLIASMLDTTPAAARKLASRARAKVTLTPPDDALAESEIVDAFLAAARGGDFGRLVELLAPDVVVSADAAAIAMGTPAHMEGVEQVATFFNGAAKTAFPVFVDDRPGAAWIHRGEAKVAFDFVIEGGRVRSLTFRAAEVVLSGLRRRDGPRPPSPVVKDLLLRPATADDVPRITAVVQAAYAHYPDQIGGRPRPMDDDYDAIVDKHRVRVAERYGEIRGVIVLSTEQAAEFWIDNVAVHPAQQGTGVGRALITHAEAVARSEGYDAVHLLTHERMTENLALYTRVGYVEYERRPPHSPILVCLRKRLGG